VLPARKTAIFVHGCFWHGHSCGGGRTPKTRTEYWKTKFEKNIARDAKAKVALTAMGWRVIVIWECEAKDPAELQLKIEQLTLLPVICAQKENS
jgi:DNA mismatch endonuclease (patch repair protein)